MVLFKMHWIVIMLLIPLCRTDDDSSVTENVIVSSSSSSSEQAASLKSQLTQESSFFKRRRRRKPLEGFLLDSSAARNAKNTTAVEIIMQVSWNPNTTLRSELHLAGKNATKVKVVIS